MPKRTEPKSGFLIMGIAIVTGIAISFFNTMVCKEIHGRFFDPYCPVKYLSYIPPAIVFIWGFVIQVKTDQPHDSAK